MLWSTRKVRSHDVAELSAFATFHSLDSPEEWNASMKEEGRIHDELAATTFPHS